jgi:hypothetical protein
MNQYLFKVVYGFEEVLILVCIDLHVTTRPGRLGQASAAACVTTSME